jgi:hypothetical protein
MLSSIVWAAWTFSIRPEWFIATASTASAVLALALALGLKEWIFRPRVTLLLRHRARGKLPLLQQTPPEEVSDRVVTNRLDTGEPTAIVRMRVHNRGRSTARRVAVRVLQVHHWDQDRRQWIRARPELDGRLLQPSNQLPSDRDLEVVDVFPDSDRIMDLASVSYGLEPDGPRPVFVEIGRPWPPNKANILDPGTWKLDLIVCGDNISAQRYFITVSFDGSCPELESPEIWDHFLIEGPSIRTMSGPPSGALDVAASTDRLVEL